MTYSICSMLLSIFSLIFSVIAYSKVRKMEADCRLCGDFDTYVNDTVGEGDREYIVPEGADNE